SSTRRTTAPAGLAPRAGPRPVRGERHGHELRARRELAPAMDRGPRGVAPPARASPRWLVDEAVARGGPLLARTDPDGGLLSLVRLRRAREGWRRSHSPRVPCYAVHAAGDAAAVPARSRQGASCASHARGCGPRERPPHVFGRRGLRTAAASRRVHDHRG